MDSEIREVLRFSLFMLRSFGFEQIGAYLSTRPEKKSVGEQERWMPRPNRCAVRSRPRVLSTELMRAAVRFTVRRST